MAAIKYSEIDITPLPHYTDEKDEDILTDTESEILDRLTLIKHKADDMATALRITRSVLPQPFNMKDVIRAWLNASYNVGRHGPPCWASLVKAVADDNGGANKALASRIAKKYPRGVYAIHEKPIIKNTKPEEESGETSISRTMSSTSTSTSSQNSITPTSYQPISSPISESQESTSSLVDTRSESSQSNITESSQTSSAVSQSNITESSQTSSAVSKHTNTSVQISSENNDKFNFVSGEEEDRVREKQEEKSGHHEEVDIPPFPLLEHTSQVTSDIPPFPLLEHTSQVTSSEDTSFVEDDGIFNLKRGVKSIYKDFAKLPPPLQPYKMNREKHHGYALIINNIHIVGREDRMGADKDDENLAKTFNTLRYKLVDGKPHRNCTAAKIHELVKYSIDQLDHTQCDSFICCLLSHGDSGSIYGVDDKKVRLDEIRQKVIQCKSLVGKPKIFFIQACRGGRLPEAHAVEVDDHDDIGRVLLPEASDVFFGYATTPDTKACRFTDTGSWYVIELCGALQKYYKEHDLLTMVQCAHYEVCTNREYVYERPLKDGSGATKKYKQSPQIVSTLMRNVYFH